MTKPILKGNWNLLNHVYEPIRFGNRHSEQGVGFETRHLEKSVCHGSESEQLQLVNQTVCAIIEVVIAMLYIEQKTRGKENEKEQWNSLLFSTISLWC